MRRRFLARVAIFVVILVLIAAGGATLLFLALSSLLGGLSGGPHGWLLAAGALLLVVLVAGGARRAAVPIGDLIEAAGRVEAGDYATRVPEQGPRELRGLSRAFNAMASRLEEDERQRRQLLADVSHELRTPLSVIQGNLEGLLDGVYPADAEHLSSLLEESRTLSRLVDDLRTLSLAEAGQLRLHPEATDLGALVRDALTSLRGPADQAGVRLEATIPGDLPALEIDPTRTREVLTNLLGNALRHTPSGGSIDVRVSRSTPSAVEVAVADTGEGMSSEVVAKMFERFYRGPGSRGSGLGLPIARELAVAQGGQISAESTEGAGTTIRFTLPIQPSG
jgi:signal transduction histidine kinase